jgi:hypothetical protein
MTSKTKVLEDIEAANGAILLPIAIPSHRRPNPIIMRYLKKLPDWMWGNFVFFVRPEWEDSYREANPEFSYHVIQTPVTNIAQTRQYIKDVWRNVAIYGIIDDDMVGLNPLYIDEETNRVRSLGPQYVHPGSVWIYLNHLVKMCFQEEPKVGIVNVRDRFFCQDPDNVNFLWQVNKASRMPISIAFIHCNRMSAVNYRDIMIGEDHMLILDAMHQDVEFAQITSVVSAFSYSQESIAFGATEEARKAVQVLERSDFDAVGYRDVYKTTKRYDDGQHAAGSINWRALNKKLGTSVRRRSRG